MAGNHDLGLEQLSALDDASTGASVPTNASASTAVEYHNGQANGAGDTPYPNKGRTAVLGENVIYLHNQYVMLEGVGFFGSPYSHGHSGNQAFQQESCLTEALQRLQLLREQGRQVDVLLAHSNALERRAPFQPMLSVWGHFHDMYGARQRTARPPVTAAASPAAASSNAAHARPLSVCASIMNKSYNPTNPPFVIDVRRPASYPVPISISP